MQTAQSHPPRPLKAAGFTLSELLASVVIVAILVGIAFFLASDAKGKSEDAKLDSQVNALNSAVQVYLASGGQLNGVSDPVEVLDKLKSTATDSQKARIAGLRESVVDPRLVFVMLGGDAVDSDQKRMVWDATKQRFEVATSGANAVREIRLDPDAALNGVAQENRKVPMELAASDSWVWDYTDTTSNGGETPGDNNTAPGNVPPGTDSGSGGSGGGSNPNGGGPGGPGGSGGGDNPGDGSGGKSDLLPPVFSQTTGQYPSEVFPLELVLTNSNPTGSSRILYSINSGAWEEYTSKLSIDANSRVSAYAEAIDTGNYTDSYIVSEFFEGWDHRFSGKANGRFRCELGGPNMTTNHFEEKEIAHFDFGVPATGYETPSTLQFSGTPFNDVRPGQIFRFGTLDFYNGTIWSGTGAESVVLSMDLALTNPVDSESFRYSFSLLSTVNQGIDPDADADYVYLPNLSTPFSTTLDGVKYYLVLRLGYEGEDGFATLSSFHVHENEKAQGGVYAYFTAVEPEGFGETYEEVQCPELDAEDQEEEAVEEEENSGVCGESVHPSDKPAYQDLSVTWQSHVNGQGSTKWHIDNPNSVPLTSNPESKVRYHWQVYDNYNGTGNILQSAVGWDNGNPNPVNTVYSKSMKIEWYLVVDGESTEILGCDVANADEIPEEDPDEFESDYVHSIPGIIEAEEYRLGGAGVAYEDSSLGNNGGAFRQDDVDIRTSPNGGYLVGWISGGEWMEYRANVTPGVYNVEVVMSSGYGSPGSLAISIDDRALGSVNSGNTGGYNNFVTKTLEGVEIDESGACLIRFMATGDGAFDVDSVRFLEQPDSPTSLAFVTPSGGEMLDYGTDLEVEVSATDDDGISSVHLYINGNFVRYEATAPYTWGSGDAELQNLTEGTYTLTAIAVDLNDNSTTEEIQFTVDQNRIGNLSVSFESPSNGDTFEFESDLNVTVAAEDPDGVSEVQLYLNGNFIATDTTFPYSWDAQSHPALQGLAEGSYTLTALAEDDYGDSASTEITVNVDEDRSANMWMSFESPGDGDVLEHGADLNVEVLVTDPDGVDHVSLYLNDEFVRTENNAPYTWDDSAVQDLQEGTYTLRAVATDSYGYADETSIVITISPDYTNNTTLSFVSPADGDSFDYQSDLEVEVAASDPQGIENVKLYLNENFVRQESNAPYDWGSGDNLLQNLGAGEYTLKAVSQDGYGDIQETSIVITIEEEEGSDFLVSFNTPADGDQIEEGSDLDVDVAASAPAGIDYVQLYVNGNFIRQENVAPYEWYPGNDSIFDEMEPGSYTLTAIATDENGATASAEITITVQQESLAYSEHVIPGLIQAEEYDLGGPGVGYYDTDSTNHGGAFRNDGVDIISNSDSQHGGNGIGWVDGGEWLRYTVEVAEAGTYEIELRTASDWGSLGAITAELGGETIATFQPGYTGGWNSWTTLTSNEVEIDTTGQTTLFIRIGGDYSADINWIRFSKIEPEEPESDENTYQGYAYQDLMVEWVQHHGQGASEWRITNPNSVPIASNPEVKLRYNWYAYKRPDLKGQLKQSASGWDNGNPNPVNTTFAKSMLVEWYLVVNGEASPILGAMVANHDGNSYYTVGGDSGD